MSLAQGDSEPRLRASAGRLDPEGAALKADFESTDFDSLDDAEFALCAAEFAALARLRQERGLPVLGGELEARIIRRLTALASARPLAVPVFGLSRSHRGNWSALARKAREAREDRARRSSAAPRAERSAGHNSSMRLPASKASSEAADSAQDGPIELPRLTKLAQAAQLVIVGGVAKPEKISRIRRSAGLALEWVGLDAGKSASAVTALAKRIRDRRLCGLVLLQGLLDHKQSEPLLTAAREVGLAVAYADKGGGAALVRALLELEKRCAGGKTASE